MMRFPAYASNFEWHPGDTPAFLHLSALINHLEKVHFELSVNDPNANQGQMTSDFDKALEKMLVSRGAEPLTLPLDDAVPQDLDFAFTFEGRKIAVEVEKANREKILRDLLKCHIYLRAGADFAIVALPRNYPHSHGVWNLFEFGVQRYDECRRYGFGTPDKLGRILLLGFRQFDRLTKTPLSIDTRQRMRAEAAARLAKA